MSVFIPTDKFGRKLGITKLPFTTIPIKNYTPVNYDSKYINVVGDVMKGVLNMNQHKITNLKTPTNKNDAVNMGYVDKLKENVAKELRTSFSENFNQGVTKIENQIKVQREQDKVLKGWIKELRENGKVFEIKGIMERSKDISTLLKEWENDDSITKNIVILQILIEADDNVWLDIQTLGNEYGIYVYEKLKNNDSNSKNSFYISTKINLPESWKRTVAVRYMKYSKIEFKNTDS